MTWKKWKSAKNKIHWLIYNRERGRESRRERMKMSSKAPRKKYKQQSHPGNQQAPKIKNSLASHQPDGTSSLGRGGEGFLRRLIMLIQARLRADLTIIFITFHFEHSFFDCHLCYSLSGATEKGMLWWVKKYTYLSKEHIFYQKY